jgi:polar amino acid transport system ATP-binding protein
VAVNKNNVKIHVVDLKKSFGHLDVLTGITEDIYEGEVVVVIGPSGSGKSTFLRCLNRLEDFQSGTVIVDGFEISDKKVNINKVRENIGMVFQQFNLFPHMTVLENITMAPTELKKMSKDDAKKRAMELLERVGLADKADSFPKQLSGGQQQRVAIARAWR